VGSSFTAYRGRGFWAQDPGIEVWLYLLARQASHLEHAPGWLHVAQVHWHKQATLGFNGCVSACLDDHLASPEQVALVLELGEQVLAWLRTQGPALSAELLNSFGTGGAGACFTGDVPIENFFIIGEAFISLIRDELTTDAANSPVL
jgi:hypothetical protein